MNHLQGQRRSVSVTEHFSLCRETRGCHSSFSVSFSETLPFSFSPLGIEDSLISSLASFLEIKGMDVCHLSCLWR